MLRILVWTACFCGPSMLGCSPSEAREPDWPIPMAIEKPEVSLFAALTRHLGQARAEVLKSVGYPVGRTLYDSNRFWLDGLQFLPRGASANAYQIVGYFDLRFPQRLRAVWSKDFTNGPAIHLDDVLTSLHEKPSSTSIGYWGTPNCGSLMAMVQVAPRRCVRLFASPGAWAPEVRRFDAASNSFVNVRSFASSDGRKMMTSSRVTNLYAGEALKDCNPPDVDDVPPTIPDEVGGDWKKLGTGSLLPAPPDTRKARTAIVGRWVSDLADAFVFRSDGTCSSKGEGRWKYVDDDLYRVSIDKDVQFLALEDDGKKLVAIADNPARQRSWVNTTGRPIIDLEAAKRRILGKWQVGNQVWTFTDDGECHCSDHRGGPWYYLEASGTYKVDWTYQIYNLTLSEDGITFKGRDQLDNPFDGTRKLLPEPNQEK